MQDSAARPVHEVCQQDDDQDHDHQPEEEHDDSGDDVPSNSSRSSHGLQLPGAARTIRNDVARSGVSPCPSASGASIPTMSFQGRVGQKSQHDLRQDRPIVGRRDPVRGISAPIDPPAIPAWSCGADVAADAACRAAAGIVDRNPRNPGGKCPRSSAGSMKAAAPDHGTGDNGAWAAWLTIPRRIDRESGWRCLVAGSGRSSLFRAPAASPNCWRMPPGWPACGPPAGVAGLAWVRAGPAGARSA